MLVDEDITAIGVRMVDDAAIAGMEVIVSVTVTTKAGGIVHALLCRKQPAFGGDGNRRWLVYYDRNADRMVAHAVQLTALGGWLRRVGG